MVAQKKALDAKIYEIIVLVMIVTTSYSDYISFIFLFKISRYDEREDLDTSLNVHV